VPARPAGPVDPAAAVREVSAVLPELEPREARALALVALADRPRAEVAGLLDVEAEELGALLAGARKELRQTITPLGGSGWCERAEGLISDRLDGVLAERDARRLDVHLRNCPRCVEHERRLVQATDALLAGIAPARPSTPPPGEAPLTAVPEEEAGVAAPEGAALEDAASEDAAPEDAAPAAPEDAAPEDAAPAAPQDAAPAAPPDGGPLEGAAPGGAPLGALRGGTATGDPEGAPLGAPSAGAATGEGASPAAGTASPAAPSSEEIAVAAEVLVAARTRGQLAAAVTWNAMVAIAVILAIASIALIVAGILGAQI
jgi:hypothetical protein